MQTNLSWRKMFINSIMILLYSSHQFRGLHKMARKGIFNLPNQNKTTTMVRESVLMRTVDRITNYIQKYVDTLGAEKKEEVLELMDNMQQLFPQWVIMPCPV